MERFRVVVSLVLAAAFAGCNSTSAIPNHPGSQPTIKHVIIMMQENRSFDNIFAGFPGADTTMVGNCEKAPWCTTGTAKLKPTTLESSDDIGLGIDIDHSHHGFGVECDFDKSTGQCRNDGFDQIYQGESGGGPPAKLYPYSYIERTESKAYWDFASRYGLADHFFMTDTASSFIAHQLILSGTVALNSEMSLTDQPDAMPWGCDAPFHTQVPVLLKDGHEIYPPTSLKTGGILPFPCFTEWETMSDLLNAHNVSWKYYVDSEKQDFSGGVWNGYDAIAKVRCARYKTPVTEPGQCHGYGAAWSHISSPNTTFFTDVKNGTLPSLSYVIPILADSDHPASGCNHGPHWVTSVIDAVGRSKYWDSTAIFLLWDDWGGWYDNVPPPQINYTSLGFRIPVVVVSPYVRPKTVSSTEYQYGSILKYIEQLFGLGSLHSTDESSNSIGDMFDYTQKPTAFANEPLPGQRKCKHRGDPSAQEIIDNAGGIPE